MPTTQEISEKINELLPISAMLNTRIDAAGQGWYRCGVPLDERTRNHFGTVHAAVQWCCAELLGGLVWLAHFNERPTFFVIRSATINFLRPARTDITVEGALSDEDVSSLQRRLESHGEAEFVLRSEVRNIHGEVLARAECHYLLRNWRESKV